MVQVDNNIHELIVPTTRVIITYDNLINNVYKFQSKLIQKSNIDNVNRNK